MPIPQIRNYPMGINWTSKACIKRKFRFLFRIYDPVDPVIEPYNGPGTPGSYTNMMPPEKAARPSLQIKELEATHLQETIYYPGRIEFKPLQVTLYDVTAESRIWDWLTRFYNPATGEYYTAGQIAQGRSTIKKTSIVHVLDGTGTEIERWNYINSWPNEIDFGELDMSDNDLLKVNLTLRYDRAIRGIIDT